MTRVRSLLIIIAMIACLLGSYVSVLRACADSHSREHGELADRCAVIEARQSDRGLCPKTFKTMLMRRHMSFNRCMQERYSRAILEPWILLCPRPSGELSTAALRRMNRRPDPPEPERPSEPYESLESDPLELSSIP